MLTKEKYQQIRDKYLRQGRQEEALRLFDAKIQQNGQDKWAWHGRGYALEELGEWEEAIQVYLQALEIDPEMAHPWHGLGIVYKTQGRYPEAIRKFRLLDEQHRLVFHARQFSPGLFGRFAIRFQHRISPL